MAIAHAIFTEHLAHILRDTMRNRQTGLLSIEHYERQGSEQGEIFFEDGDAVFARTPHEWGEAALARIVKWQPAYYSFSQGIKSPIQANHHAGKHSFNAALLTLLAQQAETEHFTPAAGLPAIPKVLPDTPIRTTQLPNSGVPSLFNMERASSPGGHAVFRTVPLATSPRVMNSMDRRDRIVFMLLDGRRTVRDIARMVHRTELDVAQSLARLLRNRYIEYAGM